MNLHSLKNKPGARKSRTRVGLGHGSGKGKTCGKGHKGQRARAGHKRKLIFEGGQMPLVRRIPKRGFNHARENVWAPVNVSSLAKFEDGSEITFEVLRKAGLASGRVDGVKILGNGTIDKKLNVKAQAFSESAKSKIEAAGGQCEVVS